jgi:hypothetical protein
MSFSDKIGNDQNGLKDILFKRRKQQPSRLYLYLPFLSSFIMDRQFAPLKEEEKDIMFHKDMTQDLFFLQLDLGSKSVRAGTAPVAMMLRKATIDGMLKPRSEGNTRSAAQNEFSIATSNNLYAGLEGSFVNPFKSFPLADYIIANRKAASNFLDLLAVNNPTANDNSMWGGLNVQTGDNIYTEVDSKRYFLLQPLVTYNPKDNGSKSQYLLKNSIYSSTHQISGSYQQITAKNLPALFPNAILIQRLKHLFMDYKDKFFKGIGSKLIGSEAVKESSNDLNTSDFLGFSKDVSQGVSSITSLDKYRNLEFVDADARNRVFNEFLLRVPALVDLVPTKAVSALTEDKGGFSSDSDSITYTDHISQVYAAREAKTADSIITASSGQALVDKITWDQYSAPGDLDLDPPPGLPVNPITAALKDYLGAAFKDKSFAAFVESGKRVYYNQQLTEDIAKSLKLVFATTPPDPVIGVQFIVPDSQIDNKHGIPAATSTIPYLDAIAPVVPVATYKVAKFREVGDIEIDIVPASEIYRKYHNQNIDMYTNSWPEAVERLQSIFGGQASHPEYEFLNETFRDLSIGPAVEGGDSLLTTPDYLGAFTETKPTRLSDILLSEIYTSKAFATNDPDNLAPPGSALLNAFYIVDYWYRKVIIAGLAPLYDLSAQVQATVDQPINLYFKNVFLGRKDTLTIFQKTKVLRDSIVNTPINLPAQLKDLIIRSMDKVIAAESKLDTVASPTPLIGPSKTYPTQRDYINSALVSLFSADYVSDGLPIPLLPDDFLDTFVGSNRDLLTLTSSQTGIGYLTTQLKQVLSNVVYNSAIESEIKLDDIIDLAALEDFGQFLTVIIYMISNNVYMGKITDKLIANIVTANTTDSGSPNLEDLNGTVSGDKTDIFLTGLNNTSGTQKIKFKIGDTEHEANYITRVFIKGFKKTADNKTRKALINNIKPAPVSYMNDGALRVEDNCVSSTMDDFFGSIVGRLYSPPSQTPTNAISLDIIKDKDKAKILNAISDSIKIEATEDKIVFTNVSATEESILIVTVNGEPQEITITKEDYDLAKSLIASGKDIYDPAMPAGFYIKATRLIYAQLIKAISVADRYFNKTVDISDFYKCHHTQISGFTSTPFLPGVLDQAVELHKANFGFIGLSGTSKMYPLVREDFNFDDYYYNLIASDVGSTGAVLSGDLRTNLSVKYNKFYRVPVFGKGYIDKFNKQDLTGTSKPLLYYGLSADATMKGINQYKLCKPVLFADFAKPENVNFKDYYPLSRWLSDFIEPTKVSLSERLAPAVQSAVYGILKTMSDQEIEQLKKIATEAGYHDLLSITTKQFEILLDRLAIETTVNLSNVRDAIASNDTIQTAVGIVLAKDQSKTILDNPVEPSGKLTVENTNAKEAQIKAIQAGDTSVPPAALSAQTTA